MSADLKATAKFQAKCVVPKVTGKKLRAAKSALRKKHCTPGTVKRAFSAKRKGTVLAQKPKPRTKLRRGGKVNLVASKGKKP